MHEGGSDQNSDNKEGLHMNSRANNVSKRSPVETQEVAHLQGFLRPRDIADTIFGAEEEARRNGCDEFRRDRED